MEKNSKDNCNCNCNDEHEHHGCGCGNEHEHHHHEIEYMHLTLDDENEVKCAVLGIFEVDNKEYIGLVPEGEEIVYIYGYDEVDGEPDLRKIEEDEEFQLVAQAFNELFNDDDDEE